jgi:hypothetical protein
MPNVCREFRYIFAAKLSCRIQIIFPLNGVIFPLNGVFYDGYQEKERVSFPQNFNRQIVFRGSTGKFREVNLQR